LSEIIAEQSQQSRMELQLFLKYRSRRPSIWVVAAERSEAGRFAVHAGDMPAAFLELQAAINWST